LVTGDRGKVDPGWPEAVPAPARREVTEQMNAVLLAQVGTVLWILAAILVIAGIVALVRGSVVAGIVLIIVGLLVGPGGVSIFD
jgi:hypothetical protein